MPLKALCQDPSTGFDVEAGIAQGVPLCRAELTLLHPPGIDLHQTVIVAAVGIFVDCIGLEIGFDFGNCPEQTRWNAVSLARFLEEKGVGGGWDEMK